jgi:hypothetical protein
VSRLLIVFGSRLGETWADAMFSSADPTDCYALAPALFSSAPSTIVRDSSTVATRSVRGSCTGEPKRSR